MTISEHRRKRTSGQGWLTTLLGVVVLIAGGFALGLIVGVISEEPELVVGHMAGRSTEVEWAEADSVAAVEDPPLPAPVAAPPVEPPSVPLGTPKPAERAQPAAPLAAGKPPAAAPELPAVSARRAESTVTRPVADRLAAAPVGESRFLIQVGAFGQSSSAQGVAGDLRSKGYAVQVLPPSGDDRWRVRVGPLKSRAEAEQIARRLKVEENLPTWVLRESAS